jgi:hypothetical protein
MSQEHVSRPAAPALKKIDLTIARLRLLLADVTAREAALEQQRRTCRDQHNKLINFSMYGDSSLDSVLSMLADVQERLAHVEATARSLAAIRARAKTEVESLQLTKSIEEAKVRLHQLQARQAGTLEVSDGLTPAEIHAEIISLQNMINEASDRAAQTLGSRTS